MKSWKYPLIILMVAFVWAEQVYGDAVIARLQPDCVKSLHENIEESCKLIAIPEIMGDRYGLINVISRCTENQGDLKDAPSRVIEKERCWVIVNRNKPKIYEEMELDRYYEAMAVFEWNGHPAVLARYQKTLALITSEDGQPVIEYQWPCPESRCSRRHQIIVQRVGFFPDEPMQVVIVGYKDYLVKTYLFYPPDKGGRMGRIKQRDQFIPISEWKDRWVKKTRFKEIYRSLFPMNLWQKLKDKVIGVDPAEEIERAVQAQIEHLVDSVRLFSPSRDTIIVTTQKPITVTLIDLNARSFRIAEMGEWGEHIRPVSLLSTFFVERVQQEGSIFWMFVDGFMVERKINFLQSHPNARCPHVETLPDQTETCVYMVGMVIRWDPETEETRWWYVYDEAEETHRKNIFLNALNLKNFSIEYLEVSYKEKVIQVKRKSF